MNPWERYVLPHLVDRTCGIGQFHQLRSAHCANLMGRVLEFGVGSGLNLQHYPNSVTEVIGVEPNDGAWARAEAAFIKFGPPKAPALVRAGLNAEHIYIADHSCDSVLSTFSLCTIPDQHAALREARRIIKPGGALVFVEHGKASDPGIQRWQRRLEPVQRRLAGGCHLTRNPVQDLEAAGFEVVTSSQGFVQGPRMLHPFGYVYAGTAHAV